MFLSHTAHERVAECEQKPQKCGDNVRRPRCVRQEINKDLNITGMAGHGRPKAPDTQPRQQWLLRQIFANVCLFILVTRPLQPVATRRQSPYLHKPAVIIMTSFSLWRHLRVSRLWRSQPPFSLWCHYHYEVILYWTGHAQRYKRTLRMDTLPRLIYKYL